ncbi:MAG: 4Fe-4S dicluster domain-containing protein [Deltaproteobacteria bacterium]|nr:4Fe-4S dicluster domain-containing protein [Deltaproteobacteria bacterium]
MSLNRRDFLKIAGITALGVGAASAFEVLSGKQLEAALKAAPLTAGKRWAMVVDTRKLREEDYHDVITACHTSHNVPDFSGTKDEIKWIWAEPFENAFPDSPNEYVKPEVKDKPFLVFCNQCGDAPCVRVCPTKATFKGEDGITMMDMHRCIGCRYCMAACPYGARSFNFRDPRTYFADKEVPNREFPTRTRGVVEKCNFCTERLAKGLYPACVEACKSNALIFGDLDDPNSEVRRILRANFSIRRKPQLGTDPSIFYIV